MAYPSGVNFQPTSGRAGVQPINKSSSAQQHNIGETLQAQDQTGGRGWGTFIYLPGVASNAKGKAVTYDTKTPATALASSSSKGSAAVSMADCLAGEYGWFAISGNVPVATATVASGASAYITSTAGQLDDTDVNYLGLHLSGAVFKSADSGGFADCQLSFPSVIDRKLQNVMSGYLIKPDCYSNGGTTTVGTIGTLFVQSLSILVPTTVTGVSYSMGTASGNVMVSLYGGSATNSRYSGVTTWGTADGATLVVASASTAMSGGTANRSHYVTFTGNVDLAPGQYWLGFEMDNATGTYGRIQNFASGAPNMRTMSHTYGTAAASLASTSESSVSNQPMMFLVASQTPLAFL